MSVKGGKRRVIDRSNTHHNGCSDGDGADDGRCAQSE
jgi:hypothetical protein